MSEVPQNQDDKGAVDLARWQEEAAELADFWSSVCDTCDACVPDCPAAKYGERFNPRDIVLKARYGLGDKLLLEESILWECFQCYRCFDRCPQDLKPVEVVARLKEMLRELLLRRD